MLLVDSFMVSMKTIKSLWLRTVNNVRTVFEEKNEYVYVPDLRSYGSK